MIDYVLELISSSKELVSLLCSEKKKTFASTVLLYHNVPMEVVSELLGHASIKVTEASYARLHQKKIAAEMKLLVKRLEKK